MVAHRLLKSTSLSPPPPSAHRTRSKLRWRLAEENSGIYHGFSTRIAGLHASSILFILLHVIGPTSAQPDRSPYLYNDLPARVSYFMTEGLTLNCSVLASDKKVPIGAESSPMISWYRMIEKDQIKEVSDSDPNFSLKFNSKQLVIKPSAGNNKAELLKQIKGSYFCQAKNDHGLTRSRKCVVNPVVSSLNIAISEDSPVIGIGGTGVLSCKIQPEYAHSYYRLVRWEVFNEKRAKIMNITHSSEKYSVVRSIYPTELHIRQMNAKDAARFYRCTVESTIRHQSQINPVIESPYMSVGLNDNPPLMFPPIQSSHRHREIYAQKGTSIELPCVFHGKVYYEWYYQNQKIYPLDNKSQQWAEKYQIVAKGHGNLRITNLEAKDSGEYRCGYLKKDKDSADKDKRSTIKLKVSAPLGVTLEPKQLAVEYKKRAVLKCRVHGYPHQRTYWLHDGKRVLPSDNVAITNDSNETWSRLEVKAVDRLSAGVYQCFSESGSAVEPHDNAQSRTMLRVRKVPPELLSQFPAAGPEGYAHIILGIGVNDKRLKSRMKLRCDFAGSSPKRITWYLDDKRIPLGSSAISLSDYQWKELDLDLEKAYRNNGNTEALVEYGGEYKAVANSPYGMADCRTFVEIDTKLMIRKFDVKKLSKPIEGLDFELKCYVLGRNSVKGVTIEWTKIGKDGRKQSLPNNHRHSVKERGRTLVIKTMKKEEDDGTYECKATDKEGHNTSRRVKLDIKRMPVINNFVDKYHIDEGQDKVTVTCNIKNQADKPWYAWWEFKRSGQETKKYLQMTNTVPGIRITYAQHDPVPSNDRRLNVPRDLTPNTWVMLEIERPKRNLHAGNYTCNIRNDVGPSSQTAQVTFKPKIKFEIQPPPTQTVVLNNNLIINCTVKGDKPKPIIEWKYFDKSGSHGDNYASIRILEKRTHGRIMQDSYGTLRVVNVSKSDPTQFMCYVSLNASDAEAISQVVKINVRYPAEIRKMKDQECKQGTQLNLTCYIEGDAPITSNWKFFDNNYKEWRDIPACSNWGRRNCRPSYQNNPFYNNIHSVVTNMKGGRGKIHQLQFRSVMPIHQTRYRCSAGNKFNTRRAERNVKVTVISAPGSPRDLKVLEYEARHIQVSWQQPRKDGNKPIKHYIITVYLLITHLNKPKEPHAKIKVLKHDSETYVHKIENLRPAVEYRLEVVAVNDVGVSAVASVAQRTDAARPEAGVQNLSANGTGSDTIRISWNRPPRDKLNGLLVKYRVCLLRAGPGSTDMEKIPESEDAWSAGSCSTTPVDTDASYSKEVTKLPKFTKYYIRVFAINQKGPSPPAYTFARTLEDVPRRPPIGVTCTEGAQSVKLQWNPPNQGDMNGILTGYTIRYFETNDYDDESSAKVINISSRTSAVVNQLQHYTNYTFRIYAVNSKGSGPPSDPARCATRASQPQPPAEVKMLAVNSSCLVASWRHPHQSYGILRFYVLMFGPKHGLVKTETVEANTGAFFNVKYYCGKSEGVEYKLAIKARNHATLQSDQSPWRYAVPTHKAPARFIGFNRSMVINDNMNADLSCQAVGSQLRFESEKNSASFATNNDLEKDPFLHLKRVQASHSGTYACKVGNLYGDDQIKYKVKVRVIKATPPVKPKLMHGRQRLHSVEVEWRPMGSAQSRRKDTPINRYWVTYTNGFTKLKTTVSVSANNRTFFLSNLTCGTVIDFKVKAENKIGNSSDSNLVKMRTKGSSPIPSGLNNIVPNGYQDQAYFNLTAAFRPGDGCLPLKYRIILVPIEVPSETSFNNPSPFRKDITINHEDLEHQCCINITGLHRGSSYHYLIEAMNAAGAENQTGHFSTPHRKPDVRTGIRILSPKGTLAIWQRPAIVVTIVLAIIVIICVVMALILFMRRRQTAEELREQQKGPVKKCVNDLKGHEGKLTEGLPPFGHPPFDLPSSAIPAHGRADEDDRLSNDGSMDSEGNINPYATFATYETGTIDRGELPDDEPRALGPVAAESGRMRHRIRPSNQRRKRAPYYEPHVPKQYENDSVSGTLAPLGAASKRRSNSLDRLDEFDPSATYNRGYATGGGGQMGRSFYEPKYPGDHISTHYRGGSVLSSTTMSSNHDELSQAYEYGRRARYESALNTTDGFNGDENLDLHTGSGSSETTDPGIRQFTQQPPMPDEQRQATCEVPLFNKTPTTDRRRPSFNASETYEPMGDGYYRGNNQPRATQHPQRQAPLPEPPGQSSTLGRHRIGSTAAATRPPMGPGAYRSRADSDSIYAGNVYDSTEYYSGPNYGRRGPMPHPAEFPRYHPQSRVPAGRYYNGGGAASGPSERHPLVAGGPGPGAPVVRPMAYGAHGGDPDEQQSLLVGRRYSVQRGTSGSGSSSGAGTIGGGSGGAVGGSGAHASGPRRSSRPNAPVGGDLAPGGLLIHVPGDADEDSETENIYTSEFTVV